MAKIRVTPGYERGSTHTETRRGQHFAGGKVALRLTFGESIACEMLVQYPNGDIGEVIGFGSGETDDEAVRECYASAVRRATAKPQ